MAQWFDDFPQITIPAEPIRGGQVFHSGVEQPHFEPPTAGTGTTDRPGGGGGGFLPSWLKKAIGLLPGVPNYGSDPKKPNMPNTSNDPWWQDVLKNPDTYRTLGSVFGGQAEGAADERGRLNQFLDQRGRNEVGKYGINQDALMNALLAQGRDRMTGYGTEQDATTAATAGQQIATTSALQNQSNEALARAKLGLEAPTTRAQQSVRGSLMQNLQPLNIQLPPGQRGHETKVSGGLSAATLDPMTRQQGGELMKQAMQAQLTGSDVPPATDFIGGVQDWKSSILKQPEPVDYSSGVLKPPELPAYEDAGVLESTLSAAGLSSDLIDIIMRSRRPKNPAPTTYPPSAGGF